MGVENPLLVFKNVGVELNKAVLFDPFSLMLNRGELLWLIGANGSGKSTLFDLITKYRPYKGSILLNGKEVSTLGSESLWDTCSVLYQKRPLLENLSAKEVYLAAIANKTKDSTSTDCLERYLKPEITNRKYSLLSGGEQQKVWLAIVEALDKELILLDEPTAHLDPWSKGVVFQTMKNWLSVNKTVIIATHDLEHVSRIGGRYLFLSKEKSVTGMVGDTYFSGLVESLYKY